MGAFKVHKASEIDLYAWFAHTAVVSCRRLITQKVAALMMDSFADIRFSVGPSKPVHLLTYVALGLEKNNYTILNCLY